MIHVNKSNCPKIALSLVVCAFVALGSVVPASAAAASTPRWRVGGFFLSSAESRAFSGTSTPLSFSAAGLNMSFGTCSVTGQIVGSGPGVPGSSSKVALRCTGAYVIGAEQICTVKNVGGKAGEVGFNNMSARLVYLKAQNVESAGELLRPETGTEFVNYEVTGAECPWAGKYPLTGELLSNFAMPSATESSKQTLEFPKTKLTSYYANAETTTSTPIVTLSVKGNSNVSFVTSIGEVLSGSQTFGVYAG